MSTKESKEGCTLDSYPAVWRFCYRSNQRIVRSVQGTGEVETLGWQPINEYYDVVAHSAALASAAWEKEYGNRSRYKDEDVFGVKLLSGPDFTCYVDATIEVHRR